MYRRYKYLSRCIEDQSDFRWIGILFELSDWNAA